MRGGGEGEGVEIFGYVFMVDVVPAAFALGLEHVVACCCGV